MNSQTPTRNNLRPISTSHKNRNYAGENLAGSSVKQRWSREDSAGIAIILEAEACMVKNTMGEERSCILSTDVSSLLRNGAWFTDIGKQYFWMEAKPLQLTDRFWLPNTQMWA